MKQDYLNLKLITVYLLIKFTEFTDKKWGENLRFDILFLNSLSPPPLPMEVCNSKMCTFKKVFMSTDKNGFSDVNLIVYIDMYICRLLFKFTLTFSEKLKILRLFTRTKISTLVCS